MPFSKIQKKVIFVICGSILLIFFLSLIANSKKTQDSKTSRNIACKNCNIIFVSFDTLRAKNTGFMGYARNTTPTLNKLASESFVFTNDISVSSWTLPSTMSWFTGVYPSDHKIINKYTVLKSGEEEISDLKKLSPGIKTLAEILKENGYRTGGFTGGAGVDHEFGFNQGFEEYTDDKTFAGFEESIPKSLLWIKQHQREKFFVFLHGYDIHGQYVPPKGYDRRFVDFDYKGKLTGSKEEQLELREQGVAGGKIFLTADDVRFLTALYDEKVQRADYNFSKFLDEYKKLNLMNKTIFIITSDHGEELYEHGNIDHGHSLYDELIHVPLLIKVPGFSRSYSVNSQVRSIDLMPTIIDLLNIKPPEDTRSQMKGQSLISLMKGGQEVLDAFSESDYRYAVSLRSLRTQTEKIILNLETNLSQFYYLKNDPSEKNDLSEDEDSAFFNLNKKLREYIYKK